MDDLLSEFLTETSENLAVLDVELVKLERNPNDMELLGNIFRLVHTVKGTCGFLGLPRLESVAHAGENILGKLRDGELVASVEAITAVLECLDRIRSIMSDLEANGSEPEGDDSALIERLNHIAEGGAAPAAEKPAAAAPKSQPKAEAVAPKSATQSIYEQIGGMGTIDAVVEVMFSRVMGDLRIKHLFDGVNLDRLQGRMREYLSLVCGGPNTFGKIDLKCPHASAVGKGMNDTHFDAFAGHMQAALNALEVPAHLTAMIMAIVFASRDEIMGRAESGSSPVSAAKFNAGESAPAREPAPAAEAEPAPTKAAAAAAMAAAPARSEVSETKDSAVANQSIRVNVELLENLMTMVSELVLTRNQVLQILRKQKDSEFAGPLQRLNHVTSELQEGVMKTRMQPIGNAWSKLPRLVRDLSHELKKKIELVMIGQDTELDRQVLEMIKDPLTHMVRNSADHGLEGPEDRRRAGKPETGKVTLNAYHEGGHIIIEVSDDGSGFDPAAASGFGLSGMRDRVADVGGDMDVETCPGRGTRIRVRVPASSAPLT